MTVSPNIRDQLPADSIESFLLTAFAPMHKRAMGLAVGLTGAALVALLTAFHVVVRPTNALSIELLSQYFYGYDVSWRGALAGAWWAFVAGFVGGWFAAFLRNLFIGLWLMIVRVRANLRETRDFLDHI
jgi:hypothetical protein